MRARDDDEHDVLAHGHLAHAVDDRHAADVPACPCALDDARERPFGHRGIVLEREMRDVVAVIAVSHHAHEARHAARFGRGLDEPLDLLAGIEVRLAHANGRQGHDQPPVTGGKKATSSPAFTASSGSAIS